MRHTPLLAALMVLCFVGRPALALPPDAQVNGLLDAVATYRQGDSRVALLELEDLVNHSTASEADKKHLADLIAPRLESDATTEAKSFLCRQLHTIGSADHVPALAALLTDKELSHMARYALERYAGTEARDALHAALHQTTGELLVGVINSVGARGETVSTQHLSPFLQDPDADAAIAAADALGYIPTVGTLRAIDSAVSNASSELQERLYLAALRAAHGLSERGRTNPALRVYERLYAESLPVKIRIAALTGLAKAQDEAAAVSTLLNVLTQNDKPMISRASRIN
ncbi:MAG: hypothetical protein ACYTGQ_17180 [Planctomycetota bacterium]|jgi:hypothetical protein